MFGRFATSVIYQTENGRLALPIEDFTIGRKLGFTGRWDFEEVGALLEIIEKESVAYVIGTHVGSLLIPLSARCKTIVGFEANPSTFKYLRLNLFMNEVSNAQVFNFAVGNAEGSLQFLANKVNSGGSKIVPKVKDYSFEYDRPESISVQMVTLDKFIEDQQLPKPDLLIIDIEGSEYLALQGMKNALIDCQHLYIEYEPNHLKFVANCSVAEFFNLFVSDFEKVSFMRLKKSFNLKSDLAEFFAQVNEMYASNIADDLLFSKKVK
jgi:FkbM family methyltransferase